MSNLIWIFLAVTAVSALLIAHVIVRAVLLRRSAVMSDRSRELIGEQGIWLALYMSEKLFWLVVFSPIVPGRVQDWAYYNLTLLIINAVIQLGLALFLNWGWLVRIEGVSLDWRRPIAHLWSVGWGWWQRLARKEKHHDQRSDNH